MTKQQLLRQRAEQWLSAPRYEKGEEIQLIRDLLDALRVQEQECRREFDRAEYAENRQVAAEMGDRGKELLLKQANASVQLLRQERDEARQAATELLTAVGVACDVFARPHAGGYVQHLANCHLRTCWYPITYAAYCKRNDGHVCTCGLAVLTEEQP